MHRLEFTQHLPLSPRQAWEFFSNPANLNRITPQELRFEILDSLPDRVYAGQIIAYRLRLPLGFKVRWHTLISQVREPDYFVDQQLDGPYSVWHHQHLFTPEPGGILMRDIVHYKVAPWPLGPILNLLYVRRQLRKIFAFRELTLSRIFPPNPAPEPDPD